MRLVATLYITRREQDPRNSPAIEQKLVPFEINVENIFCLKKSPRGSWFARSPPDLSSSPRHRTNSHLSITSLSCFRRQHSNNPTTLDSSTSRSHSRDLNLSLPQNISFKSYSRDSGHGGSEQEDSPRTHNTMTLGHSGRNRGARGINEGNEMSGNRTTGGGGGGRRAALPYKHKYTEIIDGRVNGPSHHQLHAHHGQHVHLPRDLANEDEPVYEEIERGGGGGGGGEIQVSDMSDEDGRRQSDMSRQSSRSYGDHRPLIPYSPATDRNLMHYGQTLTDRGGGGGNIHCDEYSPAFERTLNTCWEKLRKQQAWYERGELPRLPASYGIPPQPDHTRTVAVLDGHTVVCHLQPQTDMYTGRGMPPPSYSEC